MTSAVVGFSAGCVSIPSFQPNFSESDHYSYRRCVRRHLLTALLAIAGAGGAAGTVVDKSMLDVPIDFASSQKGISLGAGSFLSRVRR